MSRGGDNKGLSLQELGAKEARIENLVSDDIDETSGPGNGSIISQSSRLQLGIAFQHINVHGFDSAERYQSTTSSYLLAIPHLIWKILHRDDTSKVGILQDFSGLVRAGEMLLVLGRPSSGCSTLLKTLAGETQGLHVDGAERINYQGISYQQMHHKFRGECNYLAEQDEHFPELTIGETLEFAAATRQTGPGTRMRSQSVSRRVASLFNLESAFNTKIGNAMIRGVSGGEKKRTSIAEAFIGGSQCQCWDNSTRGLDSATALGFIELLRSSTNSLKLTAIVSIYQASDPMFKNFDKVTLLYQGRQIYFGPISRAADYFTNLGFERSSRATTADFLTSITHPAERVIKKGYENRVPRSPDDFANVWKQSSEAKALYEDIASFNLSHPQISRTWNELADGHTIQSHTLSIPIWQQVVVCVQRDIRRLKNNYVPVVAGVIGNTIIAIVVGSVFFNLSNTSSSLDSRAVLIFFALMVNAFAPAFELIAMWAQRPIVEKHARYSFYHPFVVSVSSICCDLPNKIATTLFFNICVYFMTNLRRTFASFFTFYVFIFFTVLTMSMFFRMVGSLSRTLEQTMAPVAMVILIFIVYTGFVIPVRNMVHWLSWLRRLNPMAFAYESLMINEFRDRQFPCASHIPTGSVYTQRGGSETVCATVGAIPGEPNVAGSSYLAIKYGYPSNHLWRNLPIILAMFVIFGVVHLLAAEYIPVQRSKGEILIFKQGTSRKKSVVIDEETPDSSNIIHRDSNGGIFEPEKGCNGETRPGMIHKQSAIFHWSNVNYSIKTKEGLRTILKGINGWVKPGTLTALMGVTGAGKTSLLDVLAGRISVGIVSGEILVDGRSRDASFQRKTGYVQQEDIHLPTATVRESLEFASLLRQPRQRTIAERLDYVDTILRTLDMIDYAETIVGVPGEGLNVEQRKRLTIAVELVTRPDLLLFLDEPTSGLDSQTAWSVCMLLRKLANHGQAILCTIHQPSSQLFQLFDRLLLLDQSGQTAYFGDIGTNAVSLINYFEANGAMNCHLDQNPAEWVMNVISEKPNPGVNSNPACQNWCDVWNESTHKHQVVDQLQQLTRQELNSTVILSERQGDEYAVSYLRQLTVVSKRIFREYWRDPTYIYSKLALCAGVSVFNGLSFYNTALDIQGMINIFFSIFLITQLFSTVDQQVIPRLISNRELFESREGRSKTYSWATFIAANVLVELFWQTIASILVFATWYYPTGMWRNGDTSFGAIERGALTFCLIWQFCLWISTFSQAVAVGIEHAETAVQIATLVFWLSIVFCGVLVSPGALPRFWTFVYRASPLTYFIDGMVTAGLANTSIRCSETEYLKLSPPSGLTCGDYLGPYSQLTGGYVDNVDALQDCLYCPLADSNTLLISKDIDISGPWKNFGFLIVYVLFNICLTFFIYWLARVPKGKGRTGGK